MSKLKIAKVVAKVVTSVGVKKVMGDVIENNTTIETKAESVEVTVGSWVLSALVADIAVEYVEDWIDEAVEGWQQLKQKWQESKQEKTTS